MKVINWVLSIFLLILIGLNIFFLVKTKPVSIPRESNLEILNTYPYLSSKILAEGERDLLINFIPLRKNLREITKEYGESFSLYFEYLPTGVSIGINEKLEFYAASLIKVPLAMAFLNAYRTRNLDIKEVVEITEDDLDPNFGDLWKKGAGAKISLEEVLRLLLVNSDNSAYRILARRLQTSDFKEIYDHIDLEVKLDSGQIYLTSKSYASILKSLYYSSILHKEDSQYILALLSEKSPDDKIRNGVPDEITIANKTGVYMDDLYQDCGIVYVPKRPYLLCMISKSSEEVSTKRMTEISRIVYKYINEAEK